LLLALGAYNPLYYVLWRFIPGFDLFRAPARWLELFAMGAALLAALGLDALPRLRATRSPWRRIASVVAALAALGLLASQHYPAWPTLVAWTLALAAAASLIYLAREKPGRPREQRSRSRLVRCGLVTLLFVELLLASRALPFTAATAPMATDLRNSTAALLAAEDNLPAPARDRFLSLSDIRYDPGDLAELRALQADRLPAPSVERLVRAAKQVEVLAPNLPLFFGLPAVDGYDGGLLPLHRYVLLQGLFLDPQAMTPDGRLAEQLDRIPPDRLLDLTGVRYVMTDKQRDLWADDVYYDLEQAVTLPPGAGVEFDLREQPTFAADALGVVAEAAGSGAAIVATTAAGAQVELALPPSRAPSEPPQPAISGLPERSPLAAIAVTNAGDTPLVLRGLSLIDRSTGAHQSVTLSPRNNFRRIHSGDVKIYERVDAPGRAWIVHDAIAATDEESARAVLADPAFDPRASVALEGVDLPAVAGAGGDNETVRALWYEAERVLYEATLETDGWLVMADAWYPGWRVAVDGKPAELLRANLLYRVVALPAGRHSVTLTYEPTGWRAGRLVSLATLAALLATLVALQFAPRFTRLPRKTL
jgi:hypothetical protein